MNTSTKPVALVTGGSRGIGLAICHRLADAGYRLVVAARDEEQLENLSTTFTKEGHELACLAFDMASTTSITDMVSKAQRCFGQLDAVVNSAGINYVAPVALANIERCQEVIQINLVGAYVLSKAAVRVMTRQRHGRIIHIGSISGTIGSPYNAIYAASKAGVAGLVKSLALELASLGITVNGVQPGTVHTELFEQMHGARAKLKGISLDEQKLRMEKENPQNRLVSSDEVAATVEFLLSEGAASINGHLLSIDGGRSVS